ncbi:hypothetical protein [Micromonospora haikouensis]|uniref:hypothetical protein n=1 Tax=Micromonospora haikouensis TaxID=686309 RepID=UPI003D7165CA
MPFSDHMAVEGKKILRRGRDKFERVLALLPFAGPTDELQEELRESMRILRSAMDWLEDTPRFKLAHLTLDDAGQLARRRFPQGCRLQLRDGVYYQRCPVALAHNRIGLSPAFTVKEVECSICNGDPEDCDHVKGFEYDGQLCYHTIKEIGELLEVSIVNRPNMPDARIMSISVGNGELRDRLGEQFRPGMVVSCDRCLTKCNGVVRNFE